MLLSQAIIASLFFGLIKSQTSDFDSVGTLFVFGFYDIALYPGDTTAPHLPEIYISTLSNTPVSVTASCPRSPALNFTVMLSVVRGTIGFISVPVSLREATEGIRNSVIVIQSTGPISVMACNRETRNVDGLVVFPVDVLGTHYQSVNIPNYNGIIQVVAWNPGITQVTIRFPVSVKTNGITYAAGRNYTQNLQQYQMLFVYLSSFAQQSIDLTNSDITANQTVAAFSANRLGSLYGTGDHTWEQLMPVTSWGTKFALVGTPGRTAGDYFKITSVTTATLTFTPSIAGDPTSVSPTSFAFVAQPSDMYRMLVTSAPVQVYLYAKSQQTEEVQGDPSSTLIPPVNQYSSICEYSTFSGPGDPFTHYAAIVAPTNKTDSLLWNGNTIAANFPNSTWVDLPVALGLSTTWFQLTPGVHDVYSIDPSVQFLIIMAGYAPHASYGTIAGSRWSMINTACSQTTTVPGDGIDNDCDKSVDEELLNGIDDDGDGRIDEDLTITTRVDGQWSSWSSWTCNTSASVLTRTRLCNNPPPSGQYALDCVGNSIDTSTSPSCTSPTAAQPGVITALPDATTLLVTAIESTVMPAAASTVPESTLADASTAAAGPTTIETITESITEIASTGVVTTIETTAAASTIIELTSVDATTTVEPTTVPSATQQLTSIPSSILPSSTTRSTTTKHVIVSQTTTEPRKNYETPVPTFPQNDQTVTSTPTATTEQTAQGPNIGAIVGGVVGGLVGLLCLCCIPLALILACCKCMDKEKKQESDSQVSLVSTNTHQVSDSQDSLATEVNLVSESQMSLYLTNDKHALSRVDS